MIPGMGILRSPSFLITYAVIQTVVFLLLIRFLDLYEHEPFSVLALMALWGAVGATSLSVIGNGVVGRALPEDVDLVFGNAISAPLVEEAAKGIALIAAFIAAGWAHRRFGAMELGGVTDGIVYGAAVGLGFAFTEDIHFLLLHASAQGLDEGFIAFAARRDFFGIGMLHHAIFTAAFGAGVGLATWSRSWIARIGYTAGGLVLAMLLHAVNNGLVQLVLVQTYGFDMAHAYLANETGPRSTREMAATAEAAGTAVWIIDYAVALAFFAVIALWLRHQRRVIREQLSEEADVGLIDPRDWELVPSYWRRLQWYWSLIRVGELERVRAVRRLHIELARLALLKWRKGRKGGERPEVERSRQKVANLKAQSVVDVYAPR